MTLPEQVDAAARVPPRLLMQELSDLARADDVDDGLFDEDADEVDVLAVLRQLIDEVRAHRQFLAVLLTLEKGCWTETHGRVLGEHFEPVNTDPPF